MKETEKKEKEKKKTDDNDQEKKISAPSLDLNTERTFILMHHSSNRWKRAERHSERHQILMQSFFALFFLL
jgi:hypothetical protein